MSAVECATVLPLIDNLLMQWRKTGFREGGQGRYAMSQGHQPFR